MERRIVTVLLVTLVVATGPMRPLIEATPFGINAHVPAADVLDEISDAGIQWIRIDLVWAAVERKQNDFDWRIYDRLMNDARERGLRVFATLQGTPQWATWGSEFNGVPYDSNDWRDFCYRATARYRDYVHAWGIWNEPNLDRFWQGTRTGFIRDILIAGAEAVRAADPDATIAAADLAHLKSADWEDWLRQVVREAGHLLDVITHHVYPNDADHESVTDDLKDGSTWPWDPPPIYDVLLDVGWGERPFWLSETGAESDDHGVSGQASFYSNVLNDWFGPKRQRRFVSRVFFYEINEDPRYPWITWGILGARPELTRKPAYDAYKTFIDSAVVDDAEVISVGLPRFVRPREEHTVLFELRNTGTTSWTSADRVHLAVRADTPTLRVTGGKLQSDIVVEPGDSVTISATLHIGETITGPVVDEAQLFARMVRPDLWFFGEAVNRKISVTEIEPPFAANHPQPAEAPRFGSASFSVEGSGDGPLLYQWRRNSIKLRDGDGIAGATTAQLQVDDISFHVLGDYDCVISNEAGSIISSPASLQLTRRDVRRSAGAVGSAAKTLDAWQQHRQRDRGDRDVPSTRGPVTPPKRSRH